MGTVQIVPTVTAARTIRHSAAPVATPSSDRAIRTEIIVPTTLHNADQAASLAIARRIIQTATAARTILRSAVPVESAIVHLPTTWATWAEIAVMRSRTTATADIRNLILAAAVHSLRSVTAIAVTRSRVTLRLRLRAAATAAAEADQAAEVDLLAVPVVEAAVRTAAVHRMVATKNEI